MSKEFIFVDSNGFYTEAEGYETSDFINTSAGAADAGKPIVLDADGNIDATMINDADIDHNSLGGLQGGTTAEYYHLTSAEETALTGGNDASTYHNHDSIYYTETELGSVNNGEGASLIGIEDASAYFTSTDVEGALSELYEAIKTAGVEYDVGVGGVTKGLPVFVSSNNTVVAYANTADRVIGLAYTTQVATDKVIVAANDTVITGVLTGATAGATVYWNGTALVYALPTGAGAYIWKVGVAKNATDLHVEVEFIKRNA